MVARAKANATAGEAEAGAGAEAGGLGAGAWGLGLGGDAPPDGCRATQCARTSRSRVSSSAGTTRPRSAWSQSPSSLRRRLPPHHPHPRPPPPTRTRTHLCVWLHLRPALHQYLHHDPITSALSRPSSPPPPRPAHPPIAGIPLVRLADALADQGLGRPTVAGWLAGCREQGGPGDSADTRHFLLSRVPRTHPLLDLVSLTLSSGRARAIYSLRDQNKIYSRRVTTNDTRITVFFVFCPQAKIRTVGNIRKVAKIREFKKY